MCGGVGWRLVGTVGGGHEGIRVFGLKLGIAATQIIYVHKPVEVQESHGWREPWGRTDETEGA